MEQDARGGTSLRSGAVAEPAYGETAGCVPAARHNRLVSEADALDHRGIEAATAWDTWNTLERIAVHRAMTPAQCFALAVEASRAALRFAEAKRVADE